MKIEYCYVFFNCMCWGGLVCICWAGYLLLFGWICLVCRDGVVLRMDWHAVRAFVSVVIVPSALFSVVGCLCLVRRCLPNEAKERRKFCHRIIPDASPPPVIVIVFLFSLPCCGCCFWWWWWGQTGSPGMGRYVEREAERRRGIARERLIRER